MSKMSQLHAELTEQASELGFESIEEAEAKGYVVRYSGQEAFLVPNIDKELEKAHDEWTKERKEIITGLEKLYNGYVEGDYKTNSEKEILKTAIDFIKNGEI